MDAFDRSTRWPCPLALVAVAVAVVLAASLARPAAAQDAPPVPLTAPLAYISGSGELVRIDESGESTVLVDGAADPVWSPDRSQIAYVRYVAETQRNEVRIVAADGGDDDLVAEGVDVAWSPDGSRLAVTVVGEGLFTMRTDGSDRRQVTTVEEHIADRVPVWSPDGTRIAFLRTDTLAGIPEPRLYVVGADAGAPRPLTGPDEPVESPSWSPDGTWIAVHVRTGQDEGGNFVGDVVKIRADGSERAVLSDRRPAFDPAWSPDGETIALVVDVAPGGERDLDLFLVQPDGSDLRRILDVDRDVDDPVWSPDGAVLAFTGITCCETGATGRPRQIWDVYAVARDGHGLRQISDDGLSMEPDFPPPAPSIPARRLAGLTRIATAAVIAVERLSAADDSVPTVLLASAGDFPDALAGAALAGHVEGLEGVVDAPLLLTHPEEVPERTAQALRELSARRVVLLGGPAAISDAVERRLDQDYDVTRVAGPHRYATAAEAARTLARNAGGLGTVGDRTTVIVASGERFPDALAAGPLGYANALPILLTPREQLAEATAQVIRDLGPEHALIVGGEAAVSDGVADAIRDLGPAVTRVAGPTRTATAARLADFALTHGLLDADDAALARGDEFADALAGAPDAGERRAPVLLTADPRTLSAPTADLLRAYCEPLSLLVVYGGEAAVDAGTVTDARRAATCAA